MPERFDENFIGYDKEAFEAKYIQKSRKEKEK
jgi:hypothetical protein